MFCTIQRAGCEEDRIEPAPEEIFIYIIGYDFEMGYLATLIRPYRNAAANEHFRHVAPSEH